MTIEEAKKHIHQEFVSDDGLDVLFRMSFDVEEERITEFLKALKRLEEHYTNESVIEKKLVYQLFSMHQTLKASMGHWKVSHPEGLDRKTCWKIFDGIKSIFSS
ncbi:hypothetical protein [Aquimarina sediminis]|uniref:hypothetical protein n=1 Tax=Aquimarina sediminis TaxID=2070536 RepID=UPI000CA04D68|nr:hypothetical protein [Aquimarina sediminis]